MVARPRLEDLIAVKLEEVQRRFIVVEWASDISIPETAFIDVAVNRFGASQCADRYDGDAVGVRTSDPEMAGGQLVGRLRQ